MDSTKEPDKHENEIDEDAVEVVSSTDSGELFKCMDDTGCIEGEGAENIDVVGISNEGSVLLRRQVFLKRKEKQLRLKKEEMNDTLVCDSSVTSTEEEEIMFQQLAPRVNCPEKIIFCIDLSSEKDESYFKLANGKYSALCMVRRIVEIFVHSKKKIDPDHEYSIMGLHEAAFWVKDFTCEPKEVISGLNELNETRECDSCDLATVFTLVSEVFDFLKLPNPQITPPPYIFRVILIYGRSMCVPYLSDNGQILKTLKISPYFFLDILYMHEIPSEENKCQEIFELFCEFDDNYSSYIFEVARNTTVLHNCMAKLLAHPLQRPVQKDTFYKLSASED